MLCTCKSMVDLKVQRHKWDAPKITFLIHRKLLICKHFRWSKRRRRRILAVVSLLYSHLLFCYPKGQARINRHPSTKNSGWKYSYPNVIFMYVKQDCQLRINLIDQKWCKKATSQLPLIITIPLPLVPLVRVLFIAQMLNQLIRD